jgi:hypothetical protein
VLDPLPRFSETLLGREAQPLGVVVVAGTDEMSAALAGAGWSEVAAITPKRLLPDFWAGITGGVGRGSPIAPTFVDTRPADLVIQRAVPSRSVAADRVDVWQLPAVTPSGCPVWVVSTAREDRISWSVRTLFPARRIDPAIDTARDALAAELVAGGRFEDLGRFEFGSARRGRGAAGAYVTDGKVAFLRQPGCA